jgi:phage baseplate assembly protein V
MSSSEGDYALTEMDRRMANMLRLGTVEQADYAAARLRIRMGDLLTGWLPWVTRRAGSDVDWWGPELGEQVIVMSPEGDPAQGVVLGAIYQNAHPAVGDRETLHRTVYADGTVVEYDRAASHLTVTCVGTVTVVASTLVEVTAPIIQLN